MTRLSGIAVSLVGFLAACATPLEQCLNAATRDMRVVDRLIDETGTNLARGYAYETQQITRTEWVICDYVQQPPDVAGGKSPPPKPRYCLDDVTDTVQKPVAIDPAAEQRKLAALTARRDELSRRAAPQLAACRAQYPE